MPQSLSEDERAATPEGRWGLISCEFGEEPVEGQYPCRPSGNLPDDSAVMRRIQAEGAGVSVADLQWHEGLTLADAEACEASAAIAATTCEDCLDCGACLVDCPDCVTARQVEETSCGRTPERPKSKWKEFEDNVVATLRSGARNRSRVVPQWPYSTIEHTMERPGGAGFDFDIELSAGRVRRADAAVRVGRKQYALHEAKCYGAYEVDDWGNRFKARVIEASFAMQYSDYRKKVEYVRSQVVRGDGISVTSAMEEDPRLWGGEVVEKSRGMPVSIMYWHCRPPPSWVVRWHTLFGAVMERVGFGVCIPGETCAVFADEATFIDTPVCSVGRFAGEEIKFELGEGGIGFECWDSDGSKNDGDADSDFDEAMDEAAAGDERQLERLERVIVACAEAFYDECTGSE
jgi:hypothetical protein